MLLSQRHPYFEILMQHLSDLMIEATQWPETTQFQFYAFWADIDQFQILFSLSPPPMGEMRVCLNEACGKLNSLVLMVFNREASWHLDTLYKALISISHLVDDLPATGISNAIEPN